MLTLAAVINGDLSALRADKPSPIVIPKRAAIPRQTRQPRARANANGFQNPSAAAPQACYQPNGSDYAVATVPPQPQDTAVTPPPVAMPAIPETVPAESPGKSDPVAACVMRIANLVRYPNSTKLTTECDWLMKTIKEGKRAERKNAQRTAVDSGIVHHLANVAGSYYGYGADAKALALRTLAAVCFSNSRNRKYLADNGVIELARTFINRHSPNPDHGVRRNALALLNNIAGSRESHEKILAYYGADEIIARVEDTEEDDVAQQAIALLRNLAFNEKMRDVLLRAGTVPALALAIKRFHLDPDTFAAMDITMAIACLVGHEESNPYLHADERTLKRIVKSFHETLNDTEAKKSYVIWKLCMSLSKLAVSEHNKVILGQIGAIECLQAALDWKVPEGADDCVLRRTEYALTGLWNLAFHEQNRLKINENTKLVRTIRMLDQKTTERIIHEKCAGLLFTLGCFSESPDGTCSVRVAPKDASTKGHVMLSYCWAEQELVVRISKRLKEAGFTVWLDIENMSGDTLEAMANAVEGASVVVVAMSSSYKESANCRMEAEYAIQRRRRIVPLLVEEGYSPDGWLGIMLGTKLFIDFSQSEYFEQKLRALQSELGTAGATGNPTAAAATTPKSPTNPLAQSQSHGSDSTVLIELQAVRAENVAMRQEIRELKEMMHRLVTNLGM